MGGAGGVQVGLDAGGDIAEGNVEAAAAELERLGADAVIAQGLEAGGHRGMFLSEDLSTQMGTLALLPQMVQALKLPVIAAGGIVSAPGIEAARALGAAGVQMGTAYLCSDEASFVTGSSYPIDGGAVNLR